MTSWPLFFSPSSLFLIFVRIKEKEKSENKQTNKKEGGGEEAIITLHTWTEKKKGCTYYLREKTGDKQTSSSTKRSAPFSPSFQKKKLCAFFVRKKTGIKIGKRASKSRFKRKKKLLAFCLSFFLATSSYTPSCQGNKKKENECKKEIQMENEKKRLGKKKKMARTLTCNSWSKCTYI